MPHKSSFATTLFLLLTFPIGSDASAITSQSQTIVCREPGTPITGLPFTIVESGRYYLRGDLTGVSGSNGITILASNVVLDFNEFSLVGVPGSLDGVTVPSAQKNLRIVSGTIREWGRDGVDLNAESSGASVQDCTIENNGKVEGGVGLRLGKDALAFRCQVLFNGAFLTDMGIEAEATSRITNCVSNNNTGSGILVRSGTVVANCTASHNGDKGIVAYRACRVQECLVESNSNHGIVVGVGGFNTLVQGNLATLNANDGIGIDNSAQPGVKVFDNAVVDNGRYGIGVHSGGHLVMRNSARGNATDYMIHSEAAHGPIVVIPAGGGNILPLPNSNHPQANFSWSP